MSHAKLSELGTLLDHQQWKQAVKLAQKLETTSDPAKAMKAYALIRSGKKQEALDVVESLLASSAKWKSTPESYRITFFCKKVLVLAHRVDRLIEAFKVTDSPIEQVDSVCRLVNMAETQNASMKLAKASKDPLEAGVLWLWAALSCFQRTRPYAPPSLLQRHAAGKNEEEKEDPMLAMTEVLLSKADASLSKVPAYQCTLFRLVIAQRRGYHDKLSASLTSKDKLWALATSANLPAHRIFETCADILVRFDADDWATWDLMARVVAEDPSRSQAEKMREMIDTFDKANQTRRGPLLARCVLALYCRDQDALLSGLKIFIERFGNRPCCVEDVRNVLIAFDPSSRLDSDKSVVEESRPPPSTLAEELPVLREERRWPHEKHAFRVDDKTRENLLAFLGDVKKSDNPRRCAGAFQLSRLVGEHEQLESARVNALVDELLSLSLSFESSRRLVPLG